MANPTLSKYVIKNEDFNTANIDSYSRIVFYRQFNFVTCEFLIVSVTFQDTLDHTFIFDGKIPSAFRPSSDFKQSIHSYQGTVRHGTLTITQNGGMKIAVGVSNTSLVCYGSVTYPTTVIDPLEEIYYFILSAPSIVQKGDNYTVSILAKNNQNAPLVKNVAFQVDGINIGSQQTNENGIASITQTATGGGIKTYVAESDQSTSQISVTDAYVYDTATDSSHPSSRWYNYGNYATVSIDSNGKLLNNTSGSTAYYCVNKDEQSVTDSTVSNLNNLGNFVMEFDLVSTTNFSIYLRGSSGTYTKGITASSVENVEHIKVEATSSTFKFYYDGTLDSTTNRTNGELVRAGFQLSNNRQVKFKNFVIYPI